MYKIYYETDNGNMPVINIEGSLDTVDDIARILAEVHSYNKNNGKTENGVGMVINLEMTDSVSEECLRMFKRLQPVYNIEFKNYSLYIEMQLNEYDLLTTANN